MAQGLPEKRGRAGAVTPAGSARLSLSVTPSVLHRLERLQKRHHSRQVRLSEIVVLILVRGIPIVEKKLGLRK